MLSPDIVNFPPVVFRTPLPFTDNAPAINSPAETVTLAPLLTTRELNSTDFSATPNTGYLGKPEFSII